LVLLIIDFLRFKIKKNKITKIIFGFSLVYILNLFIVEMIQFSNISAIPSISYTLKIYLLLFVSYFVYKHAKYYLFYLDKILLINTLVILLNIIAGYTFELGWQSYSAMEDSYRGFLAGNDTSIFAFTSFGYALFKYTKESQKIKKTFYLGLMVVSIYAMYIIATKAIFLAVLIIILYSIRNGIKLKTFLAGISMLIGLGLIFMTIPSIKERIFSNYLVQQKQSVERLNIQVVPESLMWLNDIAPGRTVIGISLVIQLLNDNIINFLLGYGVAGVYEAFGRPPMMHLFSPFGHYGLLGWLIFYYPQLVLAINIIKKNRFTMITTLYFTIFLYGSLGGFVYGNAATSVLYALLFALSLYEIKLKKGVKV